MGFARPHPRRRATRAWRSRFMRGGALALLGLSCDFPEPEACRLACGPSGECPSAFECQPETLLCAPRGMREPCTSTLILPGSDPPMPPDAGGVAPSEPAPSEPGDAGE